MLEKIQTNLATIRDALQILRDARKMELEIDSTVIALVDTTNLNASIGITIDTEEQLSQTIVAIIQAYAELHGKPIDEVIESMMG